MIKTSTLYLTHAVLITRPEVQILDSLLKIMKFPEPKTVVGVREAVLAARGSINPNSGFVMIMDQDCARIRNIFDLTDWFNKHALAPL